MKLLLVYASNSGNTLLTARRIAERLTEAGFEVTVQDVVDTNPDDLAKYQGLVLGSCTWERNTPEGKLQSQLPEQFHRFTEAAQTAGVLITGTPCAVFGLGRHEYTGFCGAVPHLQVLLHKLGGREVVKPLKIDGFPQHQTELIDEWAAEVATGLKKPAGATSP